MWSGDAQSPKRGPGTFLIVPAMTTRNRKNFVGLLRFIPARCVIHNKEWCDPRSPSEFRLSATHRSAKDNSGAIFSRLATLPGTSGNWVQSAPSTDVSPGSPPATDARKSRCGFDRCVRRPDRRSGTHPNFYCRHVCDCAGVARPRSSSRLPSAGRLGIQGTRGHRSRCAIQTGRNKRESGALA